MHTQPSQWMKWKKRKCIDAMKQRIDYFKSSPEAMKGMLELEKYVATSGLEKILYELVKTRASQINGCAYCLDMHTKDARKAGETEQRLYALSAWRNTFLYKARTCCLGMDRSFDFNF